MPETHLLRQPDGIRLATQRYGDGATHLVFVPGFFSHVELQWADPAYARFLGSLGRFATVTLYDKRGGGASDPIDRAATLEEHVADLGHLIDSVPAERARHGGRTVKSTGDGFLAIFDEAPSAVRAASAVIEQVRRLGLELRCGAHAGPIDVLDDGDVAGTAVNTAARVAALASAGEILVSDAVRARLAASVPLRPWGVAELKGLPGSFTLHAVEGEVDELPPMEPDQALAPAMPLSTRVMTTVARNVLGPANARRAGVRNA